MSISTGMTLMVVFAMLSRMSAGTDAPVTNDPGVYPLGKILKQFPSARRILEQSTHFDPKSPSSDWLSRRLISDPMCALLQTSAECSTTAQGSCNGNCQWEANKCDVSGLYAQQQIQSDPEAMNLITQAALTCGPKSRQACTGDQCDWDGQKNECGIHGQVMAMAMLGGSEGMAKVMQVAGTCAAKSQGQCSGDCMWENSQCAVTPAGTIAALGCGASSGATRAFISYALFLVLALAVNAAA